MLFTGDGQRLVVGEVTTANLQATTTIRVRQVTDGKILQHFESVTASQSLKSIALSKDEQYLLAGTYGAIYIWRMSDGALVRTIDVRDSENDIPFVTQIVFTADDATFMASVGRNVGVWNVSNGEFVKFLISPSIVTQGGGVAISSDGRMLARREGNYVVVRDVSNGTEIATVPNRGGVRSFVNDHVGLVFSPDGQFLAVLEGSATMFVWRLEDSSRVAQLSGHTDEIMTFSFSPDGQYIASSSGVPRIIPSRVGDRIVRLWNPLTGELVQKWNGPKAQTFALAFAPDSSVIALCSADLKTHMWSITR